MTLPLYMPLLLASLAILVGYAVGTVIARARLRRQVAELLVERQQLAAMRDDLSRMVLHDLRTPVNQIALALDIIDEEPYRPSDSEEQRALEIAQRGVRRLNEMVNTLFDVGRLESRDMPIRVRSVSATQLVEEALAAHTLAALQKQVALISAVADDLQPLQVDPDLFGRVLQNLVGNAIKFTPAGGAVRVAAIADESTSRVEITVQDTGPGIEADLLPRLFTKFARGSGAGSGTGLGLAFCRLAVEAHGGTIVGRNNGGTGAAFIISLPTVAPAAAHDAR